MSDTAPFETRRVLPKGYLGRGPGLRSLLLSTLATAFLIAALAAAALLMAVIASRGDVRLTPGQAAALAERLGDAAPGDLPSGNADAPVTVTDAGVLPVLAHEEEVGPGWLLAAARALPRLLETRQAITALVLAFAFFAVLQHWLELAAASQADRLGRQSADGLRSAVHRQALRLNVGDLDDRGRRDSQDLFTNQTESAQSAVSTLAMHVGRDPLRLAVLAILLLLLDWRLAILAAIPAVIAVVVNEAERARSEAQQNLATSRAQRTRRLLSEGLRKSRLINGYGLEAMEHEQFDHHLARHSEQIDTGLDSWRWRQRVSWTLFLFVAALVTYLVGVKVVYDADFGVFEGALFVLCVAAVGVTLSRAREVPAARKRVRGVSTVVNRYLDRTPEVSQAVGARFLEPVTKHVAYEKVSLTRGGKELLKDFELRLPAGSKTAFVSHDRAAARAAAFLLPRFIEPDAGRVLFDGEDTVWATLDSLRAECCYVGGREPFFTGSVRDNIAAGEQLTLSEVTEAAKLCHAHKFIADLKDGYETMLGEHGESLAPGPSYLLGLARAMTRDPAVLILEEPSVGLDEDIKDLIDDVYQRVFRDRTIVLLPARLSSVRRCDQVVLLADGRAAAIGHQQDLVKSNELYRHWEYVTFSPLTKG